MTAIDVEVQVGTAPLVDVDVQVEPPTFTVVSVLPTGPRGPAGPQGDDGPQGIPGNDGADGADGAPGADGEGVPTGGTAGQVLTKDSGTDFDTSWQDPTGGVGSGVVETIVAGSNVDVDATDPANPIVSMETLVDADIPASIARDSEVTSAISTSEAGQVRDGDTAGGVLSGTYPNPGFAADMATQAELDAGLATKQPLDADLTALAAAGNSAVLAATTASFLTADETKLDGIEAGAQVNPTSEAIQDIVGAMVTGGTETGIAVSYDDTNARLDFVAEVTQAELDAVEDGLVSAIADGDASTLTSAQSYADGKVDNTAYGAGWNGDTTDAPSKNAVYDEIELRVPKSLYDANTVLTADTDNTPAALTMGASTILARLAAGNIVAATPAQLRTLLTLVIGTDVQAWDADLDALATAFARATASGPASLAFLEDTDNGTNKATVVAPASMASDRTITLPDATGTLITGTQADAAYAPIGAKVCKVYRSAALTLTNNSAVAIAWDAEETDTHGWHDNVTNNTRITPNVAGKYLVSANWRPSNAFADQKQAVIAIRKNGTDIRGGTQDQWTSGTSGLPSPRAVTTVEMNGSTDYLEVVYFHLHGADRSLDTSVSSFEVVYLGT